MATVDDRSDLIDILHEIVIPCVASSGISRMWLAAPKWSSRMNLPDEMTVMRVKLRGGCVKSIGRKPYGATALFDATWPEDNLHSSRMPVWCFVVQGPVACQITDYVLHCDNSHSFLIPPGIPFADGHFQFVDETKPHQGKCTRLQIQPYHGGLYCWRTHNWMENGHQQYNECSYSLPNSRVSEYLYQLLDEVQERHFNWRTICHHLLQLLLETLYRELRSAPSNESGKVLSSAISERPQHTIARIERYIHQNLARDLTIETLSRRAAMSKTAFTMQFRARTGKSVVEYLTDLRMKRARELLKNADLAVNHIASALGITPDYFRILFRQQEGISPSQYRDKYRKKSTE